MKKIIILFVGFILLGNSTLFAKEIVYNADRYRDPLEPWLPKKAESREEGTSREPVRLSIGSTGMPPFVVQGMVWGTDMPQAIIDGGVYKIGDNFQQAKILDITKDGIKLIYGDKIFIMKPEITDKTEKSRR